MTEPEKAPSTKRVVYLFGAGASHGCVKAHSCNIGILMRDLEFDLTTRVKDLVENKYQGNNNLRSLVSEVLDQSIDYEHFITFLDQSVSAAHRNLAVDLRKIFEEVLRNKLALIESEVGEPPTGLYQALFDMYRVPGFTEAFEELGGVMTTNYDEYLEKALESSCGISVDFGISFRSHLVERDSLRVLKLHGSFGWKEAWPLSRESGDTPLWIPPGIQKAKDRYPFNVLWGLAREMLDCDILRIVGCRLGPNDWDLISLLFSTRNINEEGRHYSVEVIDSPEHAAQLKSAYPYLDIQSILEIEPIGRLLISEFSGREPREFTSLTDGEKTAVLKNAGSDVNWFRLWLKQMAETAFTELGSLRTELGKIESLLLEA